MEIVSQIYGKIKEIKSPVVTFNLCGISTIAWAIYKGDGIWELQFNIDMLRNPQNKEDFLKYTVPHEVAHIVNFEIYEGNYWSSEGYMSIQDQYEEILTDAFTAMENISSIIILPSFMINENMTIRDMREASSRLQCNILVVYKITSDIFSNYINNQEEGYKAYATCEAFLLHTKSGSIPLSISIIETFLTVKNAEDIDKEATMKRAEQEAIKLVLQKLLNEINIFFFPEE